MSLRKSILRFTQVTITWTLSSQLKLPKKCYQTIISTAAGIARNQMSLSRCAQRLKSLSWKNIHTTCRQRKFKSFTTADISCSVSLTEAFLLTTRGGIRWRLSLSQSILRIASRRLLLLNCRRICSRKKISIQTSKWKVGLTLWMLLEVSEATWFNLASKATA